jgi:fructose-1,6-bisphosphatase/inositol monophosphatase family enzyme
MDVPKPVRAHDAIVEALLRAAIVGARVAIEERSRAEVFFKPYETSTPPVVALACSIVTKADLLVQETILGSLLDSGLGGCAVVAEEDTPSSGLFRPGDAAPVIFIDPIDGTLAYAIGCPGWEGIASSAGFPEPLLRQTKEKVDSSFYGMVLGALIPGSDPVAVCVLPEHGSVYHASQGIAFRNGVAFRHHRSSKPLRVSIGRQLLDADGKKSTPFALAGIDVSWFSGSSPAVLWRIFHDVCTAYADVDCGFDAQLATVVARAAGLLVSNRNGDELVLNLHSTVDGIVFASSTADRDQICAILHSFSGPLSSSYCSPRGGLPNVAD